MIRLSVLAVVCAMCVLPLHARLHAPLEAHVREGLLSEAAWPVDVSDDDTLNVWAVQAPLSEEKFGSLLGNLNLFHCGIMIENTKTNVNTTWEFVATDFGAFFPSVTKSSNGTFEMEWKNGALVVPPHATNMTYWSKFKFVGTITGSGYKSYASTFTSFYNATQTKYNLFRLIQPVSSGPVLPSSTCFDFQFASLQYLHAQPGSQLIVDQLKRDVVALYASSAEAVNIDDPATRMKVAQFYLGLNSIPHLQTTNITKLFTHDIPKLLQKLGTTAFTLNDGQYYAFTPTKPYFQLLYQSERLW